MSITQKLLSIFSILPCMITHLHAQYFFDESSWTFYEEITAIILQADRTPKNKITFHLRTVAIENQKGSKDKLVIRFVNDSVFEKIEGRKKTKYVIRKNSFLQLNTETGKGEELRVLESTDSAGYKIIAHKTHPEDSLYASYCRIKYDSLNRMTDYYYSFGSKKPAIETWIYEGDTLSIHSRYETVNDTLRLRYQDYVVHYTQPDSSFSLRTTERIVYNKDGTTTRSFRKSYSQHIIRDKQQRIVKVVHSDREHHREGPDFTLSHIMEVEYKKK